MEGSAVVWSLEEIHDRLAHGVIADKDDLMGMGECLNLLEALEACKVEEAQTCRRISQSKQLLNALILGESLDPEADWAHLRALLSEVIAGILDTPATNPPNLEEEAQIPLEMNDDVALFFEMAEQESTCAREESLSEDRPQPLGDPELAREFIEEAREHLESIELHMIALENNPTDAEVINAVFRPFHSIKGVSGFLNLTEVHQLSHEVENLLDMARSGKLTINERVIDVVLNSVDVLKMLLEQLETALDGDGLSPPPCPLVPPLIEAVRALQSGDRDAPKSSETQPSKKLGTILIEKGLADEHVIQEALTRSSQRGTRLGEELVAMGVVSEKQLNEALQEQAHFKETSSVRVDTLKLDNLVDMVGELVIAQSMVLQNQDVQRIRDQKLHKDMSRLGRITAELQRIVLSMRMVPIRGTFQKLIRLVRDLSKKSGKDAVLEMSGEETEIDRNMIELIYEPLVHMIRNSMDHGIESPEERIQAGKPGQGKINLSAEQKGGNILIQVRDDGRGLDGDKIYRRALERGIIAPGDKLDERSIYELIFHPGFSTKDAVTEVSGRGVGMDVVKESVDRLRGKIEISNTQGQGSQFTLKLPLTMAIIDGMIIRVGEERFIVPTTALKESLRPSRDSYYTVQGKGEMIRVRENLMPLIRLHKIFQVEPLCCNPWEGLLLVVNEDNRFYSLLADEILGRQEVVIKNLGSTLRNLKGISGGAILGDGRVALILDVKGLVSLYEEGRQA